MEDYKILFTDKYFSTVKTDASVCLNQCLKACEKILGADDFNKAVKLASSSAAGGLRMSVIGLTPSLSIAAGRNVTFGAGAKIMKTFSGLISHEQVSEIINENTEILLFCGGYENGNTSVLLKNAQVLAKSNLQIPIIFAGNSFIAKEVREILLYGNRECFIVNNIMPNVNELDTIPTETIIRDVFMQRIVNMKGLESVKKSLDGVLMPTPAAVLSAGELLAKGTTTKKGVGDLIIVDIGGATTDIHSFAYQSSYEGAKIIGSSEAYAKRTVEGDLGMRESSNSLSKEIGYETFASELNLDIDTIKSMITNRVTNNDFLANSDKELMLDFCLTKGAVKVATRRHAGYTENVHSNVCKLIQKGKNLSKVNCIIGTGGSIVSGQNQLGILNAALRNPSQENNILLPAQSKFFIDSQYILYAAGLLREINEQAAFEIMISSIRHL